MLSHSKTTQGTNRCVPFLKHKRSQYAGRENIKGKVKVRTSAQHLSGTMQVYIIDHFEDLEDAACVLSKDKYELHETLGVHVSSTRTFTAM